MPILTLDYPGNSSELDLDLSEDLWSLLNLNHDMLTPARNGGRILKREFFQPVKNTHRYLLKRPEVQDSEQEWWALCDRDGNPNPALSDDLDADIDLARPGPKIVLILESPHRDEYDDNFSPLRPARGRRGTGIHYCLASHVLPMLIHFGLELDDNQKYDVYLVNPVPYQASLQYLQRPKRPAKKRDALKSAVWWKLWDCCKPDFERRLEDYRPQIVLNGCTGEFKDAVGGIVRNLNGIQHFHVSHPSRWQSVLSPIKSA